jgi:hypothetical protein
VPPFLKWCLRRAGSDVTRVTCVYPLVAALLGSELRPERRVSDISQTQTPHDQGLSQLDLRYPPFGAAVVLLVRPSLGCTGVVDLASRQDPGAGCGGAHPAG